MNHDAERRSEADEREAAIADGILAVREGQGANCSSIGSVVDALFATAVLGGAVFAAIAAALGREEVTVVPPASPPLDAPPPESPSTPPPPPAPR